MVKKSKKALNSNLKLEKTWHLSSIFQQTDTMDDELGEICILSHTIPDSNIFYKVR